MQVSLKKKKKLFFLSTVYFCYWIANYQPHCFLAFFCSPRPLFFLLCFSRYNYFFFADANLRLGMCSKKFCLNKRRKSTAVEYWNSVLVCRTWLWPAWFRRTLDKGNSVAFIRNHPVRFSDKLLVLIRNTKDRMPGPGGGNLQSTGKITAAILENGLINSFYFKEMRICSQKVKKFTFVSSRCRCRWKTFQWHHTETGLCERRHKHLELHVLRRCITVTCPVLVLHNTFPFTPFASRSMSFGPCHRFNQASLIFFSMKFNLREFF